MTGTTTPATSDEDREITELPEPPPRRRRRRLVVLAIVVLVGAGAFVEKANPDGVSLSHPLGTSGHNVSSGSPGNATATSTATVVRRSLSSQTSVSGSLGYSGSYTVLGQGHGTITQLPAPGQVVHERQVLYSVDGNPVVLLYGSTPAYRDLAAGVTGQDVRQLNHDLVALGYLNSTELDPNSNEFSSATKLGVERLQDALGVSRTGKLALGDCVFLPTAARVTAVSAKLGGPISGPVVTASSTSRQVTVNLDASEQSEVKAGDHVSITLPNNQTTPGTVTSVGAVATTPSSSGSAAASGSTPTVEVDIAPSDPAATGSLDQAPVQVAITTATVSNALVVPTYALLALSGGGYAVEIVDAHGAHHLVAVSLGMFDDSAGQVQVSGSGLAAGQRVVVPAS